jgi:prepilin-type N-terminal cleavage/methylation domain-containing protein
MTKNNQGFTLFELLISISIIGILIAVASSNYSSAQKKARDARRVQDISNIQKALEQYYSLDTFRYPVNKTTPWRPGGGSQPSVLDVFPLDPKMSNGIGWTDYFYLQTGTSYCLCASMENSSGGNSSTIDGAGMPLCSSIGGTGPFFCAKNQQ